MEGWRHLTFAKALEKVVSSYRNNEILVYRDERMTYSEFKQNVDKFSKGLIALGVKKGDRVGIYLPNYPEWIIAQWAIVQIGSVLVSINPRYRAYDLEYLLNNAKVSTLILTDRFQTVTFYNTLEEVCPEVRSTSAGNDSCGKVPSLKHIIMVRATECHGNPSFADIMKMGDGLDNAELQSRIEDQSSDDIVYLLYTSGTTSYPKGAVRTHDNIIQHAYDVGEYMGTVPGDRSLAVIPLCGAWGVSTLIPANILHGACLIIQDDFKVEETLRLIQEEKITIMHGVDVMFRAMIDFPDRKKYDLSTLKRGGAALFASGTELMREIIDDLGVTNASQALGMTELNACWLMSRYDDPKEMRINTIGGWVMPGLECLVKDPLTGEILPQGQVGELCVKGYTVLSEYYRSPEETNKAFDEEGWFHTGDLGVCDGENHYCFKGRLKEMYKSSGFNVTPREVEEFLQNHPKISAVGVVGVPHPEYGETGMAFIELTEGAEISEQEILQYCKGKIASYKIPKYIVFVDALPRVAGPHGDKISKPGLKEMASKELLLRSGG